MTEMPWIITGQELLIVLLIVFGMIYLFGILVPKKPNKLAIFLSLLLWVVILIVSLMIPFSDDFLIILY